MSKRGDRDLNSLYLPGHPVREEMDFWNWMETHPMPWPKLAGPERIYLISTSLNPNWLTTESPDDELPWLVNPYEDD